MNTSDKNNPKKIIGIQFSILSPEEIRRASTVEITNRDTYVNNKPAIGGLFDPRMGVLESGIICPTDGHNFINTPGYFGHINLAKPVFYIQYLQTIIKILKCVCIKCSKLLIDREKYSYLTNQSGDERWHQVFSLCNKIKRCGEDTNNGCGCKQPHKIKKEGLATIIAEWDAIENMSDEDKSKLTLKLNPELVLKIFKRISNEDVDFMGFSSIWSRPDWMICQTMAIPPPAIRPSVKHDSQQRSEDDLTHIIINIIKANRTIQDKIDQNSSNHIIEDWTTVLQYYVATLIDNKIPGVASVAQRSGRPLKSLKERLNGKAGRVRGNLMGKRVDFSARSVITPDPNLSIRELGIPLKIAKNITKPVIVNDRNKKFLMQLIRNGPDVYPGAKIYEKANGESISLRYVDKESIVLENGDRVHRHMMDGDAVLFNRQPTLHRMSMMCHIAKIMPRGDTFRMNVADTKPYNADFDGDEMNLHMPQDEEAECELRNLAAVPYQIISPANNKSIVGIFQDSLLGIYRLTRPDIYFNTKTAMNLLMHLKTVDLKTINFGSNSSNQTEGTVSSFEVLSQIFPNITLKYKTKRFQDSEDYATSNNVFELNNGKYVRGQIEKGVLGDGSKGLLQRVYNDYDQFRASKFVDDLQNIVTEYMKLSGFSVGISDLIADHATNNRINQTIDEKILEVKTLIDETHLGIFENRSGKSNEQEFEQRVNNILNRASLEAGKIGRENLDQNNRFVVMVNAGSKGSDLNISQMISCLGQQNVDGKRIPYGFENRTLPHFTKFDDSPSARGFIENSFIGGLRPEELFFHAMGGRVGLIDTAVKSVTWDTPIVIIENNEPKYVKIGEFVDTKMKNNDHVEKHDERNLELLNTNNIFIPTTNEDGIVSWEEVTALTRHDPGEKLYQIKTLGGRDVIVTENKSLLIWQEHDKKLKEMYSPDIKIGDCVPVTQDLCEPPIIKEYIELEKYLSKEKYIYGSDFNKAVELMKSEMISKKKIPDNWWENNNKINFILPYSKKSSLQRTCVRSNTNNIKNNCVYPYSGIRNNTEISDKFVLNKQNGVFIGLFLAEGHINNSHITITNNNESIRNFVKSWFDSYNINYSEITKVNKLKGTTTTVTGNSCIMSEFITRLLGSGAKNKYVPDEAFIAPKEFVIGLLNGYFSGDGYISKNSIEASSASKRLIEGINMLCSRLGIFGKVFTTTMKKNNINTKNILPAHRISIRAQWGKLFAENVDLIDNDKSRKLYNAKFTTNHRNFKTFNNVVLDKITEINIIGVENYPKMYDLTIPTTLNFGLANGLQVRDTSQTGYIQRRLIKGLEDLMVTYDFTVRNNQGKIIQYRYGDDCFDPVKVETQQIPFVYMSLEEIYSHYQFVATKSREDILNVVYNKSMQARFRKQQADYTKRCKQMIDEVIATRDEMVERVFKNIEVKSVVLPVAFSHIIQNVKGHQAYNVMIDITPNEIMAIIDKTYNRLSGYTYVGENRLFKTLFYFYLSPKQLIVTHRMCKQSIELLMIEIELYFKRAIVAPGEMVGMIAAQSIGEPTTQMSEPYDAVKKIVVYNKSSKQLVHRTVKIGELCDSFIEKHPERTMPTGHHNSVETLLDSLDEEYYIIGVDREEKTHWNKISHFSRHPVNGDLVTVQTKSGRSVTTTLSHSHLMRKDHQVQPVKGSELRVGMRIPVCQHIDNKFVNMTVKDDNRDDNREYLLDYEFGTLVGKYLADGSVPANKADIVGFLQQTCGQDSFNKHIPDFIFTAPLECKAAVLRAYMDGDGNITNDKNHHQIRCSSRSERLVQDVALLFNYFDIFATLSSTNNNNNNNNNNKSIPMYHLAISANYAEQYREKIGSETLKDRLDGLCDYNSRSEIHSLANDIDKIEGLGAIIAECGKQLGLPGQSRNYGRWRNKESIGRRTLKKYIEIFQEAIGEKSGNTLLTQEMRLLKQAAESNIIWDEIVDIQITTPDQSDYVYDFTVPGNQTFMEANGILVHNTLNTFHYAGVASKSNVTRGVPRIEEILSLSENPKAPSCTVYLPKNVDKDQEAVKKYINKIEYTRLRDIVDTTEICFDPDDYNTLIEEDRDTFEQYREFEKMLDECGAEEMLKREKSKWILRITFNVENMLDKNVTMDDVHFAINNAYKNEVSCLYTDYNSEKLVFRLRLNNLSQGKKSNVTSSLDQSDEIYMLTNFQNDMLDNLILHGVKRISKVLLRKITDNLEKVDGSYKKQESWVLDTVGTNLLDILALDFIDPTRTITNDIVEIHNILGIEAARQAIKNEFSEVIEFDSTYINDHHLSMLVDRMCCNDKMVSIFRHGINNDDIGPIAKASFEETPEIFLKAARHAELDTMKGVSANVMCGQEGYFGTSSFQVVLDLNKMTELATAEEKYVHTDNTEFIDREFGELENTNEFCSIANMSIYSNIADTPGNRFEVDDDYDAGF